MLLAALNVRFRDVKYTIPFLTQIGLFVTPIIYPVTFLPPRFQGWLALESHDRRRSGIPRLPVRRTRRLGLHCAVPGSSHLALLLHRQLCISEAPSGSLLTSSDVAALRTMTESITVEGLSKRYELGAAATGNPAARSARATAAGTVSQARAEGDPVGSARRVVLRRSKARSSASSAAMVPARARCSRYSRRSRIRLPAECAHAGASPHSSKSAPASTRN